MYFYLNISWFTFIRSCKLIYNFRDSGLEKIDELYVTMAENVHSALHDLLICSFCLEDTNNPKTLTVSTRSAVKVHQHQGR